MKKHLAVLVGVGLIAATAIAVPVIAADKNKGSQTVACGDNGTITASPTVLWPPNHKDVPITFTYTDNDALEDAQSQTLTITAKLHDEVLNPDGEASELNGSGNTPFLTDALGGTNSDNDGSVDVVGSARSERSGRGDGREYRYEYRADDGGTTDGCESDPDDDSDDLVVTVPHDCRAVDGGNSACNDN